MKTLLFLIAIMLLVTTTNAQWRTSGPLKGGAICLATNGAYVFTGTTNGLFLSADSGDSWMQIDSGTSGLGNDFSVLTVSGTNMLGVTYGDVGVLLSADSGASWQQETTGLPVNGYSDVNTIVVQGSYIFAGTYDKGMFVSTNNGVDWTPANNGMSNDSDINSLVLSGANLFAGTGSGVWLSVDSGANWTPVNGNNVLTNSTVNLVAVNGSDIFAVTDTNIFLSTDNGASWTEADAGLPAHTSHTAVTALAFSGSSIFAGTNGDGLFISTNNGSSWMAVNTGQTAITTISSITISGDMIYVASSTVWENSLADITTGIQEAVYLQSGFKLYPVPAVVNFVIETPATGEQLLEVFDITGKMLLTQAVNADKTTIDASGLAAGVYIVSLKSAGQMETDRLVISK